MEYPLIIDGLEQGKIRVQNEGLYTVFEAELADVHEGLYRIWLHGDGESAYLGLMQPWSGGMYLRRKLSRSEQRHFPKQPEYASNANGESLHNINGVGSSKCGDNADGKLGSHNAETAAPSGHEGSKAQEAGDELLWFKRPDGSLVSFDGESQLVALPVQLRHESTGAVLRRIEGREYMIFRY